MRREEAIALIDRLLLDVPKPEHPKTLAWTLWGMAPSTATTDYARVIHSLMLERYAAELRADVRSAVLAQLAVARTFLADRRFETALAMLVGEEASSRATGLGTLERLRRALLIDAYLQVGRLSDGMGAVDGLEGHERDPAAFRVYSHEALALVALVRGDLRGASTAFNEAVQAAAQHDHKELSAWQAARGTAGGAHVALRVGNAQVALQLLTSALVLTEPFSCVSEVSDLLLLRGICQLATGQALDTPSIEKALGGSGLLEPRGGATDLVVGLPVDLAGARSLGDGARRFEEAIAERQRAHDPVGEATVSLGLIATLVVHQRPEDARQTLARCEASVVEKQPSLKPWFLGAFQSLTSA